MGVKTVWALAVAVVGLVAAVAVVLIFGDDSVPALLGTLLGAATGSATILLVDSLRATREREQTDALARASARAWIDDLFRHRQLLRGAKQRGRWWTKAQRVEPKRRPDDFQRLAASPELREWKYWGTVADANNQLGWIEQHWTAGGELPADFDLDNALHMISRARDILKERFKEDEDPPGTAPAQR